MTDSTKLIERLRDRARQFFGHVDGRGAASEEMKQAAALIEQQAAQIAALESAAKGEPIYQTCFIHGQWRDVDWVEYERAKGLREDLARIVYTAPAAIDNGGGRDEVGGAVLTPAQWADVYYFARASEIGAFVGRAQEVFDAALSQKAGE